VNKQSDDDAPIDFRGVISFRVFLFFELENWNLAH
jgi:hypothetical protein